MKAVQLLDIGNLELTEIESPHPGKGQIVIRMLACGICGTDRHIMHGEYQATFPLVMGHEFGGEVISIGEGVEFSIGDLVSVDPNIVCMNCDHCEANRFAHCRNLKALGVALNGGFSEEVLVPASQVYKISKKINPLHLGLVEPLACCIRGVDLADIKIGEKVAIFGGGPMGMLMVQLAKRSGAGEVVLITRQKTRREIALKIGADKVIDPKNEDERRELIDFDVAFEAAGVSETFHESCKVVRAGGTVIVLGVAPAGETTPLNLHNFLVKGIRIVASYLNPATQERAVKLLESEELDLDSLITRTISLDELPKFLADDPKDGEIKVIVQGKSKEV